MMHRLFLASVLTLASVHASAQAPSPPPPQNEDNSIEVEDRLVGTGWDRGRRLTVPVSITGAGPFDFVVDTGSERTVISRELADRLGLAAGEPVRLNSIAGVSSVDTVIIPARGLNSFPTGAIEAPALASANLGAAGLLGIDSLQKQRVVMNFAERTILIQPAKVKEQKLDPDTITVTARSRFGRLILTDAEVDRGRAQVIIDTGAQTSIGNEALRKRIVARGHKAAFYPMVLTSVTGEQIPAQVTLVESLRIGGVTFTDIPMAFADVHAFKKLGLANRPALLLGMDALRLFDMVAVDFANRRVRFVLPGDSADDRSRLLALND